MKNKTELITVPNFMFDQENQDGIIGASIHVRYYNGSIELSQLGNSILIQEDKYKDLFNEIQRHYKHAENIINSKSWAI